MHGPAAPIMSAAEASQLLEHVVHDQVRELIDFCCLLDFEQELWRALLDCGLARDEVPLISAQLIARALTRIGEEHVKLATEPVEPTRPPD
jgi:hypothetical protein